MDILRSRLDDLETVLPFAEPCLDLALYYNNEGVTLPKVFNDVCRHHAIKTRKNIDEFCEWMKTDNRHIRSAKYKSDLIRKEKKRLQDRKASLKKRLLQKAERLSLLHKIVLMSKLLKNHFIISESDGRWIKPKLKVL